MAFNIKNEEANRLARELSAVARESLTEAVAQSPRERLERIRARGLSLADELDEIAKRCVAPRTRFWTTTSTGFRATNQSRSEAGNASSIQGVS